MRDEGSLDQEDESEGSKKYSDSGYGLKIEPREYPIKLNISEKKKKKKSLSRWNNGIPSTKEGAWLGREKLGEKMEVQLT